jgi:hypothetical protein
VAGVVLSVNSFHQVGLLSPIKLIIFIIVLQPNPHGVFLPCGVGISWPCLLSVFYFLGSVIGCSFLLKWDFFTFLNALLYKAWSLQRWCPLSFSATWLSGRGQWHNRWPCLFCRRTNQVIPVLVPSISLVAAVSWCNLLQVWLAIGFFIWIKREHVKWVIWSYVCDLEPQL